MARAKARHPIRVRHNPNLAPVGQAVQIALMVLVKAKKNDWAALVADPDCYRDIDLNEHQQVLLNEHAELLPVLSRKPLVSIYSCPACGRFALLDSAAAPARCNLTLGCDGRPSKSTTTPWKGEETDS